MVTSTPTRREPGKPNASVGTSDSDEERVKNTDSVREYRRHAGYEAARVEKSDQTPVSVFSMIGTSNFGRRISDLPKAIRRLLTDVPFLFLCASFSFSRRSISIRQDTGINNNGPIVLVGGGFGAIIGGALVSRWNLDYEGIMRLCMYNCCFSWFGVLIFTFSCPQGIYATPNGFVGEVVTSSFSWHCHADCNCTTSLLNPICGADGVVYLSPCLAGCQRELQVEDLKMYSGCTCINGTVSQVPGLSSNQLLLEAVQATRSRCSTDCVLLFPFLAGIFLSLSACFLNAAPATAASIRCVKPAQRSLALGIRQVIGRLAGESDWICANPKNASVERNERREDVGFSDIPCARTGGYAQALECPTELHALYKPTE
ncbi:hypothetical protein HPB51_008367 [Rhipicephalus microplus]|uniref:Kazal-like domain-containing protein n=1 Tax=Rhipicephalus microplus TaxID=6941 RepID=A0A9J6DTX8_RHIMP|nr:hypothetical protein HPB51_008367 [Rhipicephalus microplus]